MNTTASTGSEVFDAVLQANREGNVRSSVVAEREDVVTNLRRYDEIQVAEQVERMALDDYLDLLHLASKVMFEPDPDSGGSMMIDKAISIAAVEHVEGSRRPLARKRRRPKSKDL